MLTLVAAVPAILHIVLPLDSRNALSPGSAGKLVLGAVMRRVSAGEK